MKAKGQILPLLAIGIIVVAVLVGVFIDGAIFAWKKIEAQTNASAACLGAATFESIGQTAWSGFISSLTSNGMTSITYEPAQGSGNLLAKGLEIQLDGTYRVGLAWDEPTHFLSIVGIDSFPVSGKARCIGPRAGLVPIAVRESAVIYSQNNPGASYTILGNDPAWELADEESGTNFRGAIFPHMNCQGAYDQYGNWINPTNCPFVTTYAPIIDQPPSAQTQKDLVKDCFAGINCRVWPETNTYVPIVSGTSSNFLCKALQDSGYKVGDRMVVVVFEDGVVHDPDPTYGNWENVHILYYAVFQLDSFLPNSNNCNHVEASLVSAPFYSLDEIDINVSSREITWDFEGTLP